MTINKYIEKGIMVWLSILGVFEAMQVTALAARLLRSHPVPTPSTRLVLPEWQSLLRPEWEIALYRIFVVTAIAMVAALLWFFYTRHRLALSGAEIKMFTIAEGIWTAMLMFAAFKQAVYSDRPQLASMAFDVVLMAAICSKIFWPWVGNALLSVDDFILKRDNWKYYNRLLTLLFPVVIFLLIDVPNVPGVVARFFVGEQFHHNDSFVYGPAMAYLSGCRLDIDIISQYGVGIGVVVGGLSKLLGGLTYENGLLILLYAGIAYYILFFLLLRKWLGSAAIAATAVIYLIKLQMFHTGVFPFAWTYGSATVARHWFDIVFLIAVCLHSLSPSLWLIALAGLACAAQIFYIPSEGVYLSLAYVFYIGMHVLKPEWRKQASMTWGRLPLWLMLLLLPPVAAVGLLRMFVGSDVFTPVFWNNIHEFVEYFLNGFGVTPIYGSLQDRQYLASLMGFVLPLVYMLTLLTVATGAFFGRLGRSGILICTLCVYGLGLYHYYVARSAVTSYYLGAVPYVMVLAFWAERCLSYWPPISQARIKLGILLICLGALFTTHNFIAYPNRFSFSRNPLTDPLVAAPLPNGRPYFNHLYRDYNEALKVPVNTMGVRDEGLVAEGDFSSDDALLEFYRQEGDFSVDAGLIQGLTAIDQPVPLISSFEIKILLQAKRKPYFYYYPLVISRPMQARSFPRTSIYTTDQLSKTIGALERDRPPYIFVEQVLLTRPLTEQFYYYYSSMLYLTDYVLQNYAPVSQGKYLVAMKRK
jgi:hypothetical protein